MSRSGFRVLGIDLGGCMGGNSAYLLASFTEERMEIVRAYKEPKHKTHEACAAFLQRAIEESAADCIAVDAPLSLPRPLLDPGWRSPPREGGGEITNPWLYRYTDYFIFKRFGLRPMPPAADRIGRITARAIEMLHRTEYRDGTIHAGKRRLPIYELFPRQIAQTLGVTPYKKDPTLLFDRIGVPRCDFDEHLLDALLCAYGGYRIAQGHTVPPPPEAEEEGWCYPLLP